jgi:hypothetical protein
MPAPFEGWIWSYFQFRSGDESFILRIRIQQGNVLRASVRRHDARNFGICCYPFKSSEYGRNVEAILSDSSCHSIFARLGAGFAMSLMLKLEIKIVYF